MREKIICLFVKAVMPLHLALGFLRRSLFKRAEESSSTARIAIAEQNTNSVVDIIKVIVQAKKASATGSFLSGKREGGGERETDRERDRGREGQAGIFKVRLGLGDTER